MVPKTDLSPGWKATSGEKSLTKLKVVDLLVFSDQAFLPSSLELHICRLSTRYQDRALVALVLGVLLWHVVRFGHLVRGNTVQQVSACQSYLVSVVMEPLQQREEELVRVLLIPSSELRLGPSYPGLEVASTDRLVLR